jgi:hypothetical protein
MMRKVLSSISFLILFGCNNKPQGKVLPRSNKTEAEKRTHFSRFFAQREGWGNGYFQNDTGERFAHFMQTNYPEVKLDTASGPFSHDAFIYALEEEFIDTSKPAPHRDWLRFVVTGRFVLPYCVTLEKKNGHSYLTGKVTNGFMGARTGELSYQTTLVRDAAYFDSVCKALGELKFWSMQVKDSTSKGGLDGSDWTIEALHLGKYVRLRRWAPDNVGDSTTRRLGRLGVQLWEDTGLVQALGATLKTHSGQQGLLRYGRSF